MDSSKNMSTQGDLYYLSDDGQASWHNFTLTEGSFIHRTLQAEVPLVEPIPLRLRQQWLPSSDSIYPPNTVVEIMGFDEAKPDIIRVRTTSVITGILSKRPVLLRTRPKSCKGAQRIFCSPELKRWERIHEEYMSHLHSRRKGRTIKLIAEQTI